MDNDQRAAAALHQLITRTGGDVDVDHREMPTTLHVHVDADTLVHGLSERSTIDVIGGGDIPIATLRRWACDAEIIPYVLNSDSVVIDVGRSRRLATTRQRQALRAMYPTCPIDNCKVPFEHTTIHHIIPWEHGGSTDLENLLPTCNHHHHDLHEGGWTIQLDPITRALTLRRPDGSIHSITKPPANEAHDPPCALRLVGSRSHRL